MYSFLTSLPNLSLYFIVWILAAFWLRRKRIRFANTFIGVGLALFLMCSTSYIPKKLIHSIEKENKPLQLSQLDSSKVYYIHVLGGGATSMSSLPATMNLYPSTLSRLVEGIRIQKQLKKSVLVTSAAGKREYKSQAQISKEAAVSMGVQPKEIEMLETPRTTLEEAMAFKKRYGTKKNVILVTSALHLPRAIEIFKDQGINVTPAPTGFIYIEDGYRYNGLTLPSLKSFELMNIYHLTVLKKWYYKLFSKTT